MNPIIIYGAGGHGKVVIDAITTFESSLMDAQILGVIDDNEALHGSKYFGYTVLGGFAELQKYDENRDFKNYRLIVAIARNDIRRNIYSKVSQLSCELITVIHPSAQIARDVTIGPGSMIMAAAVLNPGVVLGTGVVINTGAIVEHDCIVHDFVHVGPGAIFAGAVEVGEDSLIGIGACVLPSIQIGRGATVAAGAVVVRGVSDGETVIGVPARTVPNYEEDETKWKCL